MNDDITADTVMTVPEALRKLRISKATFYRAVKAGEIHAIKFRNRTLVRVDEIERVLSDPTPLSGPPGPSRSTPDNSPRRP
jgi:excisionase family DNA binding protein